MKIGGRRAVILLLVCVKFDKLRSKDVVEKIIHCITEHMICSLVPFSAPNSACLRFQLFIFRKNLGWTITRKTWNAKFFFLSRRILIVILLGTLRNI